MTNDDLVVVTSISLTKLYLIKADQ